MQIFTSRFANSRAIIDSGALPIRTSIGGLRWTPPYSYASILELAPDRAWLNLPQDRYEPLYLDRLERLGVGRVRALLDLVVSEEEAVVLLCFENLGKPGAWCHRRMFAEWWEGKTGDKVPELPDHYTEKAPRGGATLFGGNLSTVSKSVHDKAMRLISEGRVTRTAEGWDVVGDSGSTYQVGIHGPAVLPSGCSCPASLVCSHMVAAYLLNPTA